MDANGAGDHEDPGGVLRSVERLVVAAGESVRRLRRVRSVSRGWGDDWADDETLGEMVAQLDEVRGRLKRLRDQARQGRAGRPGDASE